MLRDSAIKLLFLGVSDSDIEDVIGAFRRAGRVARGPKISNIAQFEAQLRQSRSDLVILEESEDILLERCVASLAALQPDVPVLLLTDSPPKSPSPSQLAGSFANHELDRLVQVAKRELLALEIRRELEEVRAALEESKQRNELLLSEHNDAVCYVTDGMIIHANPRFWDIHGGEELDGFPIIDLISAKDQERFKHMLKRQAQGNGQQQIEVGFCGSQGEATFAVQSEAASYDGEDCIQLTLREPGKSDAEGQIDPSTRFASRQHFITLLQGFLTEEHSQCAMLMVSIDNFRQHRAAAGLLGVEALVADIGKRIGDAVPSLHQGRLADDVFAFVSHQLSGEQALDTANAVIAEVAEHIFEVDRQSLQCTLSGVVMPITRATAPDAKLAINQCFEQLQSLMKDGGNQITIQTKAKQQLSREESVSDILNDVFADKRLSLLYQPMINLSSAHGDHYEVSLDIKDWQEGEVTAAEIMRLVERDPLDNKLDRWIVMEATKQLAQKRLNGDEICLVINLSSNVFHDPEFCSWLGVAMRAAGLPQNSLILQFAEENIAHALKPALEFTSQIKQLGVGTGIRNFCHNTEKQRILQGFAPRLVKPGGRRGDELEGDALRDCIKIAHEIGAQVLVTNVNTPSTMASMWQLGPDFIQGSYIEEPQPSMNYQFAAFG